MKTLQFTNVAGTVTVNYLTDLIEDNQVFTVYQAKEIVDGVEQVGLTDTAIALGFDYNLDEYDIATFTAFAEENDYILKSYENTVSGIEVTTIYDPVYGAGGIGEEEL